MHHLIYYCGTTKGAKSLAELRGQDFYNRYYLTGNKISSFVMHKTTPTNFPASGFNQVLATSFSK